MRIRTARLEDLSTLLELEKLCFDDPWSEASIRDEIVHPHAMSLLLTLPAGTTREERDIVGYAFFRLLLDDAELLRFAIQPRSRRRGWARRFLRQSFEVLRQRDIRRCWLEVRSDNSAALGLYQDCGFIVQGRRSAYYRDGCDALLLENLL